MHFSDNGNPEGFVALDFKKQITVVRSRIVRIYSDFARRKRHFLFMLLVKIFGMSMYDLL